MGGRSFTAWKCACLFGDGFSRAVGKPFVVFLLKVLISFGMVSHLCLCLGCLARSLAGSELRFVYSCSRFRTMKFRLVLPIYVSPYMHSARRVATQPGHVCGGILFSAKLTPLEKGRGEGGGGEKEGFFVGRGRGGLGISKTFF